MVLDEVQRGAVQEAARRGYELVVHPSFTDGDDPIGDVIDFARRSRVDGLLVMAPVSGLAGLPEALANAGVAACALSAIRIAGYASTLVYGEREGAALAARHLVALGHRRIGMITGPDLISSRERCEGFLAVLAENDLQLVGEARGDYGFESGVKGAAALFALDPRPTAIFAANDIMAAGVIKAAANHAIPVPSALSVVGFDNNLLAHVLTPALTTVDRPMRGIAEAATAQLIDIVEDTHDAREFVPQLRLVVGESSAPPPREQ
jgi:LacI family transcriptional regulator